MSRDIWGNERHEHIHTGWTVTFDMDGKRWNWNLSAKYRNRIDVEMRVYTKYPTATNIRYEKHICEV